MVNQPTDGRSAISCVFWLGVVGGGGNLEMFYILTLGFVAQQELAGDSDLPHQESPLGLEPQHPPGLVVAGEAVVVRKTFWLRPPGDIPVIHHLIISQVLHVLGRK